MGPGLYMAKIRLSIVTQGKVLGTVSENSIQRTHK